VLQRVGWAGKSWCKSGVGDQIGLLDSGSNLVQVGGKRADLVRVGGRRPNRRT
jgi:hypothetical protein